MRERDGLNLSTATERSSSNIVRLINVLFGHDFFDSLIKLNDIKTRTDHETGGLPSHFWNDVADALNVSEDDDDDNCATIIVISPEDAHYEELMDLDLDDYDATTGAAARKKFNLLMKVLKVMKRNMTISGEHDNDPYNFVDVAMKKVGGSATAGLTTIGCYYFYKRCASKEHEGLNDAFVNTMDEALMGNTNSPLVDYSGNSPESGVKEEGTSSKKRAYAAIVDMSNVVTAISNEMKKATLVMEKICENDKEKNKLDKCGHIIQLAKHLGEDDMLRTLLADLASGRS